jgi:hypothetical protein
MTTRLLWAFADPEGEQGPLVACAATELDAREALGITPDWQLIQSGETLDLGDWIKDAFAGR